MEQSLQTQYTIIILYRLPSEEPWFYSRRMLFDICIQLYMYEQNSASGGRSLLKTPFGMIIPSDSIASRFELNRLVKKISIDILN